jgi:hypothetical protein
MTQRRIVWDEDEHRPRVRILGPHPLHKDLRSTRICIDGGDVGTEPTLTASCLGGIETVSIPVAGEDLDTRLMRTIKSTGVLPR